MGRIAIQKCVDDGVERDAFADYVVAFAAFFLAIGVAKEQ